MNGEHLDAACRSWLELVERARDAEHDEQVARMIADHVAACPDCAASEAALTSIIDRYRRCAEPALPEHLEERLLDLLVSADRGQPSSG